jgi:hypothetical protein
MAHLNSTNLLVQQMELNTYLQKLARFYFIMDNVKSYKKITFKCIKTICKIKLIQLYYLSFSNYLMYSKTINQNYKWVVGTLITVQSCYVYYIVENPKKLED